MDFNRVNQYFDDPEKSASSHNGDHEMGHNPGMGHSGHTTSHSGGHDPGMGHIVQSTPASDGHGGHNPGMGHVGHTTIPNNHGGNGDHMGHGMGHNPTDSSGHDGHSSAGGHSGHALHYLYSPQMNHMSFILNTRPLLTQYKEIPNEEFCVIHPNHYPSHQKHCEHEYCQCTQVIHVGLGQVSFDFIQILYLAC